MLRMVARRLHKEFASRFGKKLAFRTNSAPIISFTFDDFPRSALIMGGTILREQGVVGTYYAAMGLAQQRSAMGRMFDLEDLRDLTDAGHELACHSRSHVSSHRVSSPQLHQDCAENRRTVNELLSGYRLCNFSFPFGDVTVRAKTQLASAYDSCRTVEWGINRGSVDLAYLRANPVYSSRPLRVLGELIEQNARESGWLILYTHDVEHSPSPYGCTPEYLKEVLRSAIASGAEILTVRDALTHFAPLAPSERPRA